MKEQELNDLMKISSERKVDFDYEGYAVIDNLKLTKGELKDAIDIMWHITMEMNKEDRDTTYLFNNGLLTSKETFLEYFNNPDKEIPREKELQFRGKLQNVEPLVRFLTKIKEIL